MSPWDILGWLFVVITIISAPIILVVLASIAVDTAKELTKERRRKKNH